MVAVATSVEWRESGNLAFGQGKYDEAVLAFQQGLLDVADDERSELLASLAIAQLKSGDALGSVETCTKASMLDPTNERVLKTAVKAYQQLGDLSSARDAKLALRAAHARASTFESLPEPDASVIVPVHEPLPSGVPPAGGASAGEARLERPSTRPAYTGRSEETDEQAVRASMGDLGDSLGPKLAALISGVDRWAARLEAEGTLSGQALALQPLDELPPGAAGSRVAVCVCLEPAALLSSSPARTDASTASGDHGLNDALLRACTPELASQLNVAASSIVCGEPSDDPAQDDATEAERRRQLAGLLRLPAAQLAEAATDHCGVQLRDEFAEWCEGAAMSEWQVCVLSPSLKPVVRQLLRDAGLGHVTALAADAVCRSDSAGWEVSAWSGTDRIRALRGWLSSSMPSEGGPPSVQLVLVGARAQDALLLRAEPPLVRTLYVVEASPLERWCVANKVRFRAFRGFEALRADLVG